MKILKSLSFKISFLLSLISSIIIFSLSFWVNKKINIEIENSFNTKEKLISSVYAPILAKALSLNDDISLISYIQNVMELQDVIYARILDTSGKILAHNKASEIGKTPNDEFTRSIIISEKTKITKTKFPDLKYSIDDISTPLFASGNKLGFLSIGFSRQDITIKTSSNTENTLVFCIVCSLFLFILNYLITSFFISPLTEIKHALNEAGNLNFDIKIKEGKDDEIGAILKTLKDSILKIKNSYTENEKKIQDYKKNIDTCFINFATAIPEIAVLTDSENRIIYINPELYNHIFEGQQDVTGKHLLEVIRNVDLIKLLQKSSENQNKIVSEIIENNKFEIISIKGLDNFLISTVIFLKKSN